MAAVFVAVVIAAVVAVAVAAVAAVAVVVVVVVAAYFPNSALSLRNPSHHFVKLVLD